MVQGRPLQDPVQDGVPAFDRRFHHREVGDPSSVALVPAADFVLLEGVEDLVEAVVGGEQDLGSIQGCFMKRINVN